MEIGTLSGHEFCKHVAWRHSDADADSCWVWSICQVSYWGFPTHAHKAHDVACIVLSCPRPKLSRASLSASHPYTKSINGCYNAGVGVADWWAHGSLQLGLEIVLQCGLSCTMRASGFHGGSLCDNHGWTWTCWALSRDQEPGVSGAASVSSLEPLQGPCIPPQSTAHHAGEGADDWWCCVPEWCAPLKILKLFLFTNTNKRALCCAQSSMPKGQEVRSSEDPGGGLVWWENIWMLG